jgi:hypothetical protein
LAVIGTGEAAAGTLHLERLNIDLHVGESWRLVASPNADVVNGGVLAFSIMMSDDTACSEMKVAHAATSSGASLPFACPTGFACAPGESGTQDAHGSRMTGSRRP